MRSIRACRPGSRGIRRAAVPWACMVVTLAGSLAGREIAAAGRRPVLLCPPRGARNSLHNGGKRAGPGAHEATASSCPSRWRSPPICAAPPGLSEPLSQRIEKKRAQIEEKKQQEGVLTTTITGLSNRIDGIQGRSTRPSSASTARRSASTTSATSCSACATGWRGEGPALAAARPSSRGASKVLAARLVEIYKADEPDALTVVLEADGFDDLLERAEFLDRISEQDREIIDRVRGLRDQVEQAGGAAGGARGRRSRTPPRRSCACATRSPAPRSSS